VWTGAHKRGVAPEQVARWMSWAPAQLIGLGDRKGAIADGYDADLFLWNPDVEETVTANMVLHRHKVTPYIGRMLRGRVVETFVGGRSVYSSRLLRA
ncbi:MAG: amidohydrolase family protein, partial [Gemmatimonadota bacterium]|nr:amidohydrolase family protein [Gemmatimonadota bacterium]